MKIIVTGAAGFIGANIIAGLNARGIKDIIAVDDLTFADKYRNIADLEISDYLDRYDFLHRFKSGSLGKVQAIFHEGACSDTMESDGHYMMENNFRYTLDLLEICTEQKTALLYASSAATYGASNVFVEDRQYEKPLNIYGYSKFLFDQILRQRIHDKKLTAQAIGFRYFNVYGPRESHKERMASVAFHHFNQFNKHHSVKLFGAYDGYNAGEQSRDFVYIDDVVKVNLYFLDHPQINGIFNLGTGRAQAFNDVARSVINQLEHHQLGEAFKEKSLEELVAEKKIEYISFPEDLKGKYQSFTQANLDQLRSAGYLESFHSVEHGVAKYVKWLIENQHFMATPNS